MGAKNTAVASYLLDVAQEELLGERAALQAGVQRPAPRREFPQRPGSSRRSCRRSRPTRVQYTTSHAALDFRLPVTGSPAALPYDANHPRRRSPQLAGHPRSHPAALQPEAISRFLMTLALRRLVMTPEHIWRKS